MKLNNQRTLAILFLIIANVIWGAAFPIYKITLEEVPPFTFVFLRFFVSAIIVFFFIRKELNVKVRHWIPLILSSIAGITLTISFINFGLKLSSSINAPIILSASPIILIIGSVLYLKEKLRLKILVGTLISFVGVLTIVLIPVLDKGVDGSITGNLFFVFAAFFSVVGSLILKKIIPQYNTLTLSFWSFLIGSIPLIPLVVNEYNQTQWIHHVTLYPILGLIFAIIACTAICHTIVAYGIKYIKASEIGIFSYVDPIATIVVAVPLLNEQISEPYIIGSFLVFLGIIVAEKRLNYHPLHKILR